MTPKQLGPYVLEERLAAGGMAEVFIAKRTGPHGFSKRVALKRMLPQFAGDADFVAMFVDEAQLAARLSHPNIVQVFDFGEVDNQLFIAMELVDGSNVNRLLRAAASRHEAVSIEIALHIAAETARALSYAHNACDDEGKPLGIVHRDVSPANLLLTRTGHVKLSDFGIARAAYIDRRTDAGQLRGKLGYMSPEQVSGRNLDGRSDIFTLSIVLAEMLMGEPLFTGGSDLDVLLRIRDVDLRVLHRAQRRIPSDVRELLMLGLNKEPERRPQARRFAEMLDSLIQRRGSTHGAAEQLAQSLSRLELIRTLPGDVGAQEPGARPTALFAIERPDAQTQTATRDAPLAAICPEIYRVRLPSGAEIGPISFPKLVELITTGTIHGETMIAKESADFVSARALPELTRFVTSPALQWTGEEIESVTSHGELKVGGLLSVVFKICADHETGVLRLIDETRRKKIYFVEGRPEFVASTDRRELLGEFLVSSGHCLRMEVEMALALLPRYGGRLGDALVGLGVLRPVELFRAIGLQVRARFLDAFQWRKGKWLYTRGTQSHEETFPLGQDPYELLRDAVVGTDPEELHAALSPVWEQALYRVPHPAIPASSFRMPESWLRVLAGIEDGLTVGAVVARESAAGAGDPESAYRALLLALHCGLLQT